MSNIKDTNVVFIFIKVRKIYKNNQSVIITYYICTARRELLHKTYHNS